MKLHELISRVDFDRIIPTLMTYDKTGKQIINYKTAYDELSLIQPKDDNETINVCKENKYISVDGCQHYWDVCLGREIKIEEGLSLTEEELLGHILWEITYFGFSAHGRSYREDEIANKYFDKAYEYIQREYRIYRRDKRNKNENPNIDELFEIYRRQQKRNRAKRMRDARLDRMIAKYKRMEKVDICINKILDLCPDLMYEQFQYMFDSKQIFEADYCSLPSGTSDKVDTLFTLFSKYSNIEFNEFDSLVFIIYGKDIQTMLSEEDRSGFKEFIEGQKEYNNLIFRMESIPSLEDPYPHCFIVGVKE